MVGYSHHVQHTREGLRGLSFTQRVYRCTHKDLQGSYIGQLRNNNNSNNPCIPTYLFTNKICAGPPLNPKSSSAKREGRGRPSVRGGLATTTQGRSSFRLKFS